MCASIAVDIDDSLYSFTDEARQVLSSMLDDPMYAPWREQLSNCLYATWDQWRTPYELCGFDANGESLWLECVAKCHDNDVILSQTPYRGAVEVLQELVDQGHTLIYISSRATKTEEATRQWLDVHNFPAGKLVICQGDKRPFIKQCRYMIDDRPKNVVDFVYDHEWYNFNQPQRKAFVPWTEFNGSLTDVPNLYLAHNWVGLRRYLVKENLLPSGSARRALEIS